jgi:hypothetical protein
MWYDGYVESMSVTGESMIRLYQYRASYPTSLRPDLGVGTQVKVIIDLSTMAITCVMTEEELQRYREADATTE